MENVGKLKKVDNDRFDHIKIILFEKKKSFIN